MHKFSDIRGSIVPKKMKMRITGMHIEELIKRAASVIRGKEFAIDPSIEFSYIIMLSLEKAFALLRGFFILKRSKVFFGKRSIIKSKKNLRFAGWLNIEHDVIIDALSAEGVILGNNCSIGKFTRIQCTGSLKNKGKGIQVGNNCGLGTHSFYGCAGGIEIGDDVIIGDFVSMHSENHNFSNVEIPIRLQGVNHRGIKIGNNCWIGAKVTILDGTVIGNGCVIAAGAVVTGIFPDNAVIGGVPAKIIKKRC